MNRLRPTVFATVILGLLTSGVIAGAAWEDSPQRLRPPAVPLVEPG